MKKLLCASLALIMIILASVTVSASSLPRVTDHSGLLTVDERQELSDLLDEISEKHKMDIIVLTSDSTGGKDVSDYCDEYYEEIGYDEDGILFFICLPTRDWYISTSGRAMTAITNYDVDYIAEAALDLLSDGDYYEAFRAFAGMCDEVLAEGHTADTYYEDHYSGYSDYDNYHYVKPAFNWQKTLVICLLIGFFVGWIIAASMKSKLRSVYSQTKASNYVREGSFELTDKKDIFLYANVTKVPIPRPDDRDGRTHTGGGSSIHVSSSGMSHGGHGGKF